MFIIRLATPTREELPDPNLEERRCRAKEWSRGDHPLGRRFVRQMEGLLGRQSLLGKGGRTPLLKELNLVADLFELQRDSGLKVSHLRLQTITGGANGVFNLAPCFLRDGLHLLFAICVLPGVRLLIVVYYVHPGWESGQHAVPARPAMWECM